MNFSKKSKQGEVPLAISPATPADLDAILEIENQSFPSPWTRPLFLAEFTKPYATILVARAPGADANPILGYVVFWLLFDELHILNLAVSPSCRRQGIATNLLAETSRRARARGCQTAWLEVRPSNQAALALYTSLGFRPVMRRTGYYEDTGEDALVMSCPL